MIRIPDKISGAALTSLQRRRLSRLHGIIQRANPNRLPELNLKQAIRGFMLTVRKSGSRWVDKAFFRLDNGNGALVINKDVEAAQVGAEVF